MGSPKLLGMNNFIWLLLLLPFNLAKLSIGFLSKKLTMSYSNMPSPTKNYNFAGAKCNSMCGFSPAVGDMLCAFIVISHGQTLKVGFITDKHYVQDPDEFMGLFLEKLNQFMEGSLGTTVAPKQIKESQSN